MGQALKVLATFGSGFLSRLATTLRRAKPIAFTDQLPLIFQGGVQIPNMALKSLGKPAVTLANANLSRRCTRRLRLQPLSSEGFGVREEMIRDLAERNGRG